MGYYDFTFKSMARAEGPGLLRFLFPGRDVSSVELIDRELEVKSQHLDALYKAALDEGKRLVHVEFEAEPTSDSGRRAFKHYAVCLLHEEDLPVQSVVIYVHPSKEGRHPKSEFKIELEGEEVLRFHFKTVCLWEPEAQRALESDNPLEWVLSCLMKGASEETVERAYRRIEERVADSERKADLVTFLMLLSQDKAFMVRLLQLIPREVYMESPFAHMLMDEGKREGKKEGKRETLLAALSRRLGRLEPWQVERVQSCEEVRALDQLLLDLMDLHDPQEICRRIEEL